MTSYDEHREPEAREREPGPICATCSQPEPCSCVACPVCAADAKDEGLGHVCTKCDWRSDRCVCGELMTFDPAYRGKTCGGLETIGARVCLPCDLYEVCRLTKEADSSSEWKIATSGRSLTAGGIKLRAEPGNAKAIHALMARLVTLPALELEVAQLRALVAKRPVAGAIKILENNASSAAAARLAICPVCEQPAHASESDDLGRHEGCQ